MLTPPERLVELQTILNTAEELVDTWCMLGVSDAQQQELYAQVLNPRGILTIRDGKGLPYPLLHTQPCAFSDVATDLYGGQLRPNPVARCEFWALKRVGVDSDKSSERYVLVNTSGEVVD